MKKAYLAFVFVLFLMHSNAQHDSIISTSKVLLAEKNFVSLEYQFDHFDADLKPWNTVIVESQNLLNNWSFISRAYISHRFGVSAWYAEQDVYKRFASNDYLFLQAGYSPFSVYSELRLSGEYFNPFANNWEQSMGFRYFQFQNAESVFLGTASLSLYSGRFLTILRANAGFKNSNHPNVFSGNIQQRYYHNDIAYSAIYVGYGVDPNSLVFNNNSSILVTENTAFNIGLKILQPLGTRWFIQGQIEFQHLNFGQVQRNQFTYSLKLYYTWL